MHSVPRAAGGITVPINAARGVRPRAAPAPPNAMSWGCLGRNTGLQLWERLVSSEGCNRKIMNMEWGVPWMQEMGLPPAMGNICWKKYTFKYLPSQWWLFSKDLA